MVINNKLNYKSALKPLDTVKYIVLHHTGTTTASANQIHDWHLKRGFNGAGYNEYIYKNGDVYIMRGDHQGAQCRGYNSVSYGICCEGNYNIERNMTKSQYSTLLNRISLAKKKFPGAKIVGHKNLVSTTCPGKYFPIQGVKNMSLCEDCKYKNNFPLPVLEHGSKGDAVTYLQLRLNRKKFKCGNVDGIFGNLTQGAVKRIQAAKKVKVDGIVGVITWNLLKK